MLKTNLEIGVLDYFRKIYSIEEFPSVELIEVLQRKNTGGGRYVDLKCEKLVEVDDGYIDLDGAFIDMKGLPSGMMAAILVENKQLKILEFSVYGGDFWDGEEKEWAIVE